MEEGPTSSEEGRVAIPNRSRARWWTHLALLTCYPIFLGVAGSLSQSRSSRPLLPTDPGMLLFAMGFELMLFGVVFGLAWWASRATAEELFLKWRGGIRPVFQGLFYSISLRFGIFVVIFLLGLLLAAAGANHTTMEKIRPATEDLVNAQALVNSPLYLLLSLTLVSFIVGGLREELWRAGMLAGLAALSPPRFKTPTGKFAAVAFTAVVFGLGHLPQGWGGVMVTGLLGLGLGLIMIYYRSIWEAALAHGFFDATSFALLYVFARFQPDLIGS